MTRGVSLHDALRGLLTRTTAQLGARPLAAAAVRGEPAPEHLWTLGKAAFAAAEGIVSELGAPRHGLVITKHGHGGALAGMQVMEGGHPLPDEASARAGAALLAAAARVRPGERVLLVV